MLTTTQVLTLGWFLVGVGQDPRRDPAAFFRPDPEAQDTSRPRVPTQQNLPPDSTMTVRWPSDTMSLYYPNTIGIVFDDTTGGATIRGVIRKYDGAIIGGSPSTGSFGAYIVRVRDPGPTFGAFDALLTRIALEPGVDYAYGLTYRTA